MNTNNLKRFAKEARIKLLDQVGRKLEFVLTHDTAELRGKQNEITQLKTKIQQVGKEQVIETVAYTWFNRLMALRFMDANGYTIPKVVTALPGMTNPEILQNALGGNIEQELQLDRQRLNDLLDGKTAAADAHTEAYKMLLVASCNQWHTAMPFMFERISDYTELLLPDDLLSDYSIVADIRNGMSEEDCLQEEVIGWLYQFYIADKKDEVFDGLKKNIKITAENIPAATQLFTPRWIVRYMVENTLGKLWLTLKPDSKLRQHMPYYIEAPEGNAPAPLPEGIKGITDITFLDPCVGSGHVLVYAFDLFTKIYEEEGYNTNEIPALILQHNLFGIDIDERAAQLAAFALTMKARSYYTRFLRKTVQPHVIALENVSEETIQESVKLPITVYGKKIISYKDLSLNLLTQADNFGSLIQIAPEEITAIQIKDGSIWQEQQQKLKEQAEYLSSQYHCVVTNPPYMGNGGMNNTLKSFVNAFYVNSKADLYTCFIERCISFNPNSGWASLINQHSWMFITSYIDLRFEILNEFTINSLLHLGPKTFPEIGGEVVQSVAFSIQKKLISENKSVFFRLTEIDNSSEKEKYFLSSISNKSDLRIEILQKSFLLIPEYLFGYWLSNDYLKIFKEGKKLESLAAPKKGLTTSDDARFLRFWFEVSYGKIGFGFPSNEDFVSSGYKFAPINKGGGYRKWYGNLLYIINWESDGNLLRNFKDLNGNLRSVLRNMQFNFKSGITWNSLSSNRFCCRYVPQGMMFNDAGPTIYNYKNPFYLMSYLQSDATDNLFKVLCPTLKFEVGRLQIFPIIENIDSIISSKGEECVMASKNEWDSRELSWDFKGLSFVSMGLFSNNLNNYSNNVSQEIITHRKREEEINFIVFNGINIKPNSESENCTKNQDLYLEETLSNSTNEYKLNTELICQQFLSYCAGCLFGRYSLDKPGLILANQGETLQDFLKQILSPIFMPDEDNIIPVLEGEWFTDDIVGRFKVFLKAAFGEDHFEENLQYIENTIGKDIRKYFVKDFYNDHIKRYKKRPIYWMFSSPKGHFKALIYLHRYQPDLCSKLLNDYLQEFISKLEAAKQTQTMLSLREDISAREKTIATKEIDKYELMLRDCREYEKTLFTIATQKISIDLDDGVKINYQKFKEVLVTIKGLEKEEE